MARFALVFLVVLAANANEAPSENRYNYETIYDFVLDNSKPGRLPTRGRPVEVTLGMDLTSIREVDFTRGEMEITAMRTMQWKDPYLAWRDKMPDLSGKGPISIDIKHIWSPDITAYNSVHAPERLSPPLAIVSDDGAVMYVPNERIRFGCDLTTLARESHGNCTITYGSWTHNGGQIDLKSGHVTTDNLRQDSTFKVEGISIEREVKHYECCPELYISVKITLFIRRKLSSFLWW